MEVVIDNYSKGIVHTALELGLDPDYVEEVVRTQFAHLKYRITKCNNHVTLIHLGKFRVKNTIPLSEKRAAKLRAAGKDPDKLKFYTTDPDDVD